jgi:hypothetical protein
MVMADEVMTGESARVQYGVGRLEAHLAPYPAARIGAWRITLA